MCLNVKNRFFTIATQIMERKEITYDTVRKSDEIRTYIKQADESLKALGFTEHAFAHCTKCAIKAGEILTELGYSERNAELARIAGFMHDIGNVVNRSDHAQSGAIMAFRILDNMGMAPVEIAKIVTAIGNHDESTAYPVNAIAAALILADKSDVRRSRVRNGRKTSFDIHDRVNFAAVESDLELDKDAGNITLKLIIDTKISPVIDYFEIFMNRMLLCKKAAAFFDLKFKLVINGSELL